MRKRVFSAGPTGQIGVQHKSACLKHVKNPFNGALVGKKCFWGAQRRCICETLISALMGHWLAKRVPKSLTNYQGLCEVGSTLGQVIEVDMETFRKTGNIRILVGVTDHTKIPPKAKLITKRLLIYYIYFQLEEVVEEG